MVVGRYSAAASAYDHREDNGMVQRKTGGFGRRRVLQGAAVLGAAQVASPFIVKALGDTPIKVGFVDPLTGSLSLLAVSEVEGAKYATAEINKKGGIMGRPVELLVEDSANDTGTGVEKIRKLIDKDQVNVTMGDVNSGIAYAISQVATQKGVLHIVPGGHTDPITGKDCAWNVFRVCNTTMMDAGAVTALLVKKYGKKWFMVSPDYAYGHSLADSFIHYLTAAGGTYESIFMPIAASDFSATLIKAKAANPNVLINNMGGLAQIDLDKQFVQFGMNKSIGMGATLFEIEAILAVPPAAQAGLASMEWWWDQPGVPHVPEFVAGIKAATKKPYCSARHWMGYVGMYSIKQAAETAKSLKGMDMAKAMEGMVLPPEVALQEKKVFYRAGDHELMPTIFAGTVHPPQGDPANVFTVETKVNAEDVLPLADTGCQMKRPWA
jgi:branched-chain amino acid transport system substrate-binding protein